jgi:hypothetical protein
MNGFRSRLWLAERVALVEKYAFKPAAPRRYDHASPQQQLRFVPVLTPKLELKGHWKGPMGRQWQRATVRSSSIGDVAV